MRSRAANCRLGSLIRSIDASLVKRPLRSAFPPLLSKCDFRLLFSASRCQIYRFVVRFPDSLPAVIVFRLRNWARASGLMMPQNRMLVYQSTCSQNLAPEIGQVCCGQTIQGFYMHSNHRLGHLFGAKKCVGVFVRTMEDHFGFRSFVSFASSSLFLAVQLACNFLTSLHQLVRDQQNANVPRFIHVGSNVSPNCFPVNR